MRVVRQNPASLTCGGFYGIGYNDNSCGLQSAVTWNATSTSVYYIVIYGSAPEQSGNFVLNISCTGTTPPQNDGCPNATPINCGGTAIGSTQYATSDGLFSSAGVWYTIQGTGNPITASLCGSSYDTYISVYRGTCNSLSLVDENDDFCGAQSQITWNSTQGVTYYILVNGYASNRGSYVLSITCDLPPNGSNDHCDGALPIGCNSVITGTTVGATSDGVYNSPGVWYVLTGAGLPITASLCNGTNFDSQLIVSKLDGGATSCISGPFYGAGSNDDACGENAEVTWFAESGATYYILVNGAEATDQGNFTLAINCDNDIHPQNDECANAIDVVCGGDYSGTTVGASLKTINGDDTYGVWFHTKGDGNDMTASLCDGTTFDTRLWVFESYCGGGGNEWEGDDECGDYGLQSEVTFQTQSGYEYFILVGGYKTNVGLFTLKITGSCADQKMAPSPKPSNLPSTLSVIALPNPSTDFVDFQVAVQQAGDARISLMNLAGQEVGTLDLGMIKEGNHTIRHEWKGVPAGIYLYSVTVGSEKAHGKLQVMH